MSLFDVPAPRSLPDPDGYCPYCNVLRPGQLTAEHIIPQSVGGTDATVIWVCKDCNNRAGSKIDTLLMRHAFLRSRAVCYGTWIKRQERQPTTATLTDGRTLEGYFHWMEAPGGLSVGFTPEKQQPDGSVWIGEESVRDASKLPPHINIFRQSMLNSAGLVFADPATLGMGPAIVKIALAMAHFSYGRPLSSDPAFNVLREGLVKVNNEDIVVLWWKSLEDLNEVRPFGITRSMDALWVGACEGKIIRAGVAFGGVSFGAEVQIPSHGRAFHGRVVKVPLPF